MLTLKMMGRMIDSTLMPLIVGQRYEQRVRTSPSIDTKGQTYLRDEPLNERWHESNSQTNRDNNVCVMGLVLIWTCGRLQAHGHHVGTWPGFILLLDIHLGQLILTLYSYVSC